MAYQLRVPGPSSLCLAPTTSRPPGFIRYHVYAGPGGGGGSGGGTATKKKARGLSVNSGSQISGAEWARIFKDNSDLPDFITQHFVWTGGSLAPPERLMVPKGTIPREWLGDYLSAFQGTWELSTAQLQVKAAGTAAKVQITVNVVPDLAAGDSVGGMVLKKDTYLSEDDASFTFGWTLEQAAAGDATGAALADGRGLVLVVNRVVVTLGTNPVQTVKVGESELVQTLIHELTCHAGRLTEGVSNQHGDATVDRIASEIKDEFSGSRVKSTNRQLSELIGQFYHPPASKTDPKPSANP